MNLDNITIEDVERWAGVFAFAVVPFLVTVSHGVAAKARQWDREAKASPATWDDRLASSFLGTALKIERLAGALSRAVALLLPLGQAARDALKAAKDEADQ